MGELLYGEARHIREQSKIDAARVTQKSGNERRGAESELQRFSASLGNQRALDAAGAEISDITTNIGHNLDASAAGTLQSRLAAAEELGASVAAASAAGVGGSSVETYNTTLRLTAAMQEEQALRGVQQDNIAASASRGSVLRDAVGSLDNNVYAADLDLNEYVDHQKPKGGLFALALAAGATYFGGPQAGMAVMGAWEAGQAAKNGDFGTANQAMGGAVNNAVGGFQAYRRSGGPVMKGLWDSTRRTSSIKLK